MQRPLVIAHRGASGVAPENTCVAISTALALGADMVEIDVQLSKDDHLVVFHDGHLGRTARCPQFSSRELRRMRIRDLTLEQIQGMDAGGWWGKAFADEPLPSLADVLEVCGDRIGLNIEVKLSEPCRLPAETHRESDAHERRRVAVQLTAALAAHRGTHKVIVSSFNHEVLGLMRQANASLKLGVLTATRDIRKGLAAAEKLKAYSLNIPCSAVTRALVETAHARGLRVFAYTANRLGVMRRLISAGIDGLFTDYPDRLLNLVDGRPPRAKTRG
jgi:glycerophosphoryl diester phosphodiesterase